MPRLQPFFTFFGGKWLAAPHYPEPEHVTIIEPFAGSAGYSVRYYYHKIILVERDPQIAATWRYLLKVKPSEILALPDVRIGETSEDCQSVDDLNVCEEARLLISWWLDSCVYHTNKFPSARMRSNTRNSQFWGPEIRQRIADQIPHLQHWTIIEGGYQDAPNCKATWFIDPPYQVTGKYYKYGSSNIDYSALGDWCRSRKGQTVVCENVGADWLPFQPWRDTQATHLSKHKDKVSHEAIWTDQPFDFDPPIVFDEGEWE